MSIRPLQRILYAEDEPHIAAVARVSLEKIGGFTLCLCSSGQEALDQAAQFKPDLILLDVMMPGLDGPATLAAMRRIDTLRETPVIFMTAKAQASELARYRALGAADVISKPFAALKLAGQLREIWKIFHDDDLPSNTAH